MAEELIGPNRLIARLDWVECKVHSEGGLREGFGLVEHD